MGFLCHAIEGSTVPFQTSDDEDEDAEGSDDGEGMDEDEEGESLLGPRLCLATDLRTPR
jgi:hypothetical protein